MKPSSPSLAVSYPGVRMTSESCQKGVKFVTDQSTKTYALYNDMSGECQKGVGRVPGGVVKSMRSTTRVEVSWSFQAYKGPTISASPDNSHSIHHCS